MSEGGNPGMTQTLYCPTLEAAFIHSMTENSPSSICCHTRVGKLISEESKSKQLTLYGYMVSL